MFMSGMLHYSLGYYHVAAMSLSSRQLIEDAASNYYLSLCYHHLEDQEEQAQARAASSMIDAIKLGAIVSAETVKMVGLDPAVHRSY